MWQRNCAPAPQAPALVDDLGNWLTAMLDRRGWEGGSIDDDGPIWSTRCGIMRAPGRGEPRGRTDGGARHCGGRRFADELGTNQRLAGAASAWCWWSPDSRCG